MEADKILVLNNGEVEALGSHSELVNEDNTYNRVYRMQSSAGEEVE
jgi:ATP-binding cassette subfamily B protein